MRSGQAVHGIPLIRAVLKATDRPTWGIHPSDNGHTDASGDEWSDWLQHSPTARGSNRATLLALYSKYPDLFSKVF